MFPITSRRLDREAIHVRRGATKENPDLENIVKYCSV